MSRRLLPADAAPNQGVRLLRILGRRWKRKMLAKRLGVSVAAVSQWLMGRRMPNEDSREILEREFGISVAAWEMPWPPAGGPPCV